MKNRFLKNTSIVVVVNGICTAINVLINFIIPIVFGESQYAYYQLENLYCGYLWIISLGWHEGVYLYYGGQTQEEINKDEIATQFWLFTGYMIIATAAACAFSKIFMRDIDKQIVWAYSAASIFIEALRYVYLYYLICINSIKKYSAYLFLDRVLHILLLTILSVVGIKDYRFMLGADILSKLVILAMILKINSALFFRHLLPLKESLIRTKELIFSGINIIFAAFVSRMIRGTVRFAIEMYWGILVFGKVSLALSISNMFTQFIQSVSTVLFPALRRFDYGKRERVYAYLSDVLDILMAMMFLLYLPAVRILGRILPQYTDSLKYMAVLMPLSLYDARNVVLNSTYLKALHKERAILASSVVATGFSFLFAFVSVYICHNLDMAVFSMIALAVIRNIICEYQLSKCLKIQMIKNLMSEMVLTMIFIIANWYIGGIYGTLMYLLILIIYLWLKRERVKKIFKYMKDSVL